ncbi:MAG TPA: hypothetical protein VGM11_10730 [Acidobacteriaceae bacterium]|jgi:hypothetical protein
MSKQLSSASLHLCQQRATIPGGSQQERERDYERTLHAEGPFLIRSELARIKPEPEQAPDRILNRIWQAIDVLLGRSHIYVERRQPRP